MLRDERPLTPCIVTRIQKRDPLPGSPRGGRLGKKAAKAHTGTFTRPPADVNVHTRVSQVSTKVIENHPGERYAFAMRGIAFPR